MSAENALPPGPGWYLQRSGDWRWWDGAQWGMPSSQPRPSRDWRQFCETWATRPFDSDRGQRATIAAASFVAVASLTGVLYLLVRRRPIGHLVDGPTILFCTVLVVLSLVALVSWGRRPPGSRLRPTVKRRRRHATDPLFPAAGLPTGVRRGLILLAQLAVASALLGLLVGGRDGSPAPSSASCRYRLSDHGQFRCVSRLAYLHAGAGYQQFAVSLLLAGSTILLAFSLARRGRQMAAPSGGQHTSR